MATLTIRNLDPVVEERLRLRAARHGRSMEAQAPAIPHAALDLALPPRETGLCHIELNRNPGSARKDPELFAV
jgi:plasmid stability protein